MAVNTSSFPASQNNAFQGSICNARGNNYPFLGNLVAINQVVSLPSGFIFACCVVGNSTIGFRIAFVIFNPDLTFNNALYSSNDPTSGGSLATPGLAANYGNLIYVIGHELAGLETDYNNQVQIYSFVCNSVSGQLSLNPAFNN